MSDQSKDYAAAAEWAEHHYTPEENSARALHGEAAAAHGRALLERAGVGRPRLDRSEDARGRSPRRQVRLPQSLSDDVDQLATAQGRTAAEVMRDAIADYMMKNKAG